MRASSSQPADVTAKRQRRSFIVEPGDFPNKTLRNLHDIFLSFWISDAIKSYNNRCHILTYKRDTYHKKLMTSDFLTGKLSHMVRYLILILVMQNTEYLFVRTGR